MVQILEKSEYYNTVIPLIVPNQKIKAVLDFGEILFCLHLILLVDMFDVKIILC